MVGQDLQAETD